MAETQQHVLHTREEWQQLLDEQRGSGQSQDAFCAARGLCKSTLQAWKRRLNGSRGDLARVAGDAGSPQAVGALFTPLVCPVENRGSGAANAAGWTVELDLGSGLCLRLRPGP